MAKNISLLGADYPDVPAVVLPKTGGGSAKFVDEDDLKTHTTTVSGTLDANGFLVSNLKYNEKEIVSFDSLTINGDSKSAFFAKVLYRAGTPADYYAFQFANYAGTVYSSGTASAVVRYRNI